MIDLGDTVPLAWSPPVLATAVAVSILQPDTTTIGPITVAPTYGTATYNFPTTQVGRHSVRWSNTGPDVEAYTDAFEVAEADPGFVISLADVKAQLNMLSTKNDDELRTWLGTATEIIEYFIGDCVPRTYTEVHNGGAYTISLYHSPVIQVQSITEYIGTASYNLTNQPVGQATSAYGFTLDDPEAGTVTRRTSASWPLRFIPGQGNVSVTYTAGRAFIPYAVQSAARIIVQHLWSTRRGAMALPGAAGGETDMIPGSEYAIPIKAIELMERYERMGGIA